MSFAGKMIKPLIKFSLIVIIAHILTYYFAGIIAQLALGASEFYPPSPNAISYLKDPHDFGRFNLYRGFRSCLGRLNRAPCVF
jgi:hypothetical protein